MTSEEEIRLANEKADEALEAAQRKVNWAHRLAAEWRESREDNNFRSMVRQLGREGFQRG